ncbi:hypothetical protein [Pontibacter sp. E15-1]|nr:hypothetical protein [Pontibacter sp. E15-1]
MKKVLYIALYSMLITAVFSACERILDPATVEVLSNSNIAAEAK